jgi:hypothetical protein
MPSLVYIAQITRSSEELAQGLQSAGLHVKSFAPGEITGDECLLVMTSEAVLAQRSADAAPGAGRKADTSQEVESAPPPSNMNAHLGSQTAICDKVKPAAAKESAASREQASSIASKIELEFESLGFIPSNIRLQTFASSPGSEPLQPLPAAVAGLSAKTCSPSNPPPPLLTDHRSRVSPAHTSAASCGRAARRDEGRRRLSVPRYRLLWQTVAIATSMLLFAAIRPSTTDATIGGTDQSTRFAADSEEPTQSASRRQPVTTSRRSKSPVVPSSTGAMKTARERRHQTDQGFVAEDFTNHFDRPAGSVATLQSSERNARASAKPKRTVVVN